MKFQKLRRIHLYLGCFFAPLIVMFIVSGIFQTLWLHYDKYDTADGQSREQVVTYQVPQIVKIISTMHMNRQYKTEKFRTNEAYRYFVLAMASGLLLTIILGVVMAFQFENTLTVLLLLLLGIFVPVALVLIK